MAEYYANKGELPADSDASGYGGAEGKYVESVEIETGVITATFRNEANTKLEGELFLTSDDESETGVLLWSCSGTIPQKYLPSSRTSSEGVLQ